MGDPERMGDVMRDLREFWQHGGGPVRDTGRPVDAARTLVGMGDMLFGAQSMTLGVRVKNGQVITRHGRGPLAGARATIETTGDVHRRVTATRLLTTGVFAFALKKRHDDRTLWLTIDFADGTQAVVEVGPKNERVARQWVAELNTRAASA